MDNVSWSDQLDVLSAVSKAGCASLQEPQKTAKMFTDVPTSRPIHQSTKCHAIIIHFVLDLLLLLYYANCPFANNRLRGIKNSQNNLTSIAFLPMQPYFLCYLSMTVLLQAKTLFFFFSFELVNFLHLIPFCFHNVVFHNV